ncbi:MAG TPA: acetate--CoA ligase family protein [Deltaproteobacteria bacterium]|jgi:acyl-CoA synthetase (NDP forming)|nr:acetate--CoA ligase family protein [Deltaproteobacteria bacterium]
MDNAEVIVKADGSGRRALSEHESKKLLSSYGVPVVRETVAGTPAEAVAVAKEIGFPVVLKGLGATLLHKTERGLVHLNLTGEEAVQKAALAIESEAKDELEGILVQPYLSGRREFVAGLSYDPAFGPVVMFGIGGIFTEALSDITLRVAPLTESDAEEMLSEIKAQSLLGSFRGEKAADREALIRTLTGLSRLAEENPGISEIDINPLLVSSDGSVCAVDALVVLSDGTKKSVSTVPVDPTAIGSLFYPKSIAFIGASSKFGKWGHLLMSHTISGGFPGDIYLVNEKGGSIAGRTVYRDIGEVPGKVDLAVVTVPARFVMDLLPKLKAKGIRNVLLISSGFGETGAQGKKLQDELVEKARQEGLLILGPNTMGISNPYINLYCTGSAVRNKSGGTAVVAQSGNMGVQFLGFAEEQGIGIRGFCGSGNEAMITIEDFIDGFEIDDNTKIVMLYIEGVRDGRRFFESARRLGRKKPIVLLKGGQSDAGSRAASSHTGAMASNAKVFDAVCRQTGIVKVEQSMDLLDLAAAFSSLPLPKGNRVGIMTLGGGWGVITADLCSRYGLIVPPLSPELLARFDSMLPPYWSRSNPVDIVGEPDNKLMTTIMEELMKWDGCDAIINLGILGRAIFIGQMTDAAERADPTYSKEFFDGIKAYMQDFEQNYLKLVAQLMETYQKPVYGVSLVTDIKSKTVYTVEGSAYKPVFYQTPERAVKAGARMYEYYRFLKK